MVGTKDEKTDATERFARIAEILKDYQRKHEDLKRFIKSARSRAQSWQEKSREYLDKARSARSKRS